ncbi:HAD-IA family hydrolase [Celeribacter litoreus]|uniref:HAD-IA family hydrolase n=1 Tax=Celeribacter litoreus TaxID=2876714 RepID=UPI001CCF04DA|nr:HAD-IA family hydrolase [Celeribacter litoreus]MCA0043651.1 HAD-IA family hydrolase [Celeribacter litoreus]
MTLKALIFDVDGTLAETEEAHRHAFNETFEAAGLGWHWDRETYTALLKITGGKERMRHYRETLGAELPTDNEIATLHETKTRTYADILARGDLTLRPGVREVIEVARARGLKLAVATTTNRPNVDALCQCGWGRPANEVFDVVAAGDEVANKKPAPDVYLLALLRLSLPAHACLAFEDSENGVTSAQRAGLRVIATPSAYTASDDFSSAEACVDHLSTDVLFQNA